MSHLNEIVASMHQAYQPALNAIHMPDSKIWPNYETAIHGAKQLGYSLNHYSLMTQQASNDSSNAVPLIIGGVILASLVFGGMFLAYSAMISHNQVKENKISEDYMIKNKIHPNQPSNK